MMGMLCRQRSGCQYVEWKEHKELIIYDTLYGNIEHNAQALKEGMRSGNEDELVKVDKASVPDIE